MAENFDIIIEGYPSHLDGYLIFNNALHQLAEQRSALIEDEWESLEDLANQGLGLAYGRYREMRRSLNVEHALQTKANKNFIELLKLKAKDEANRQEFFLNLKNELLNLNPNVNPDVLDGLTQMGQGVTEGTAVQELIKAVNVFYEVDDDMNKSAIEGTVAQAVRSLIALTHVNFHFHDEFLKESQAIGPHGSEFFDMLTLPVATFKNELEAQVKKIYLDLISDLSPVHACETLAQFIQESLPKFGRIQATIRQYALALKNAGKGSFSEKVGKLSALAGDLTRFAYAAQASAYYLSLQSKLVKPESKAKRLLNKSSSFGYDTTFPNGKDVEISKLAQQSDGAYVEVSGFVTAISATRDGDNKLLSRVTLLDPSSNASVTLVGIFVHFRHIGLLEGSYCNVSGTWQSSSVVNSNNPAIEIEKLSVNELSKSSWLISFLDLSDRLVDRWPGGLNIRFALSPHISAPEDGNDESDILGAGELIFKPFRRR